MRSLRTATKSSPRSPQPDKARTQQQRPNAAKNKNKLNKLKKKKRKWAEGLRGDIGEAAFQGTDRLHKKAREDWLWKGAAGNLAVGVNPEEGSN